MRFQMVWAVVWALVVVGGEPLHAAALARTDGGAPANGSAAAKLPWPSPRMADAPRAPAAATKLGEMGAISGTVYYQASGAPAMGMQVWAYSAETWFRSAVTGSDGSYVFPDLPASDYQVCVGNDQDVYINQCWDHVTPNAVGWPSNGTPITLAAGEVRPNINFHLRIGAFISGLILDRATGQPLPAYPPVTMELHTSEDDGATIYIQTDESGRYYINGLAPMSYYLIAEIYPQSYIRQIYAGANCVGDVCDFSAATKVTLVDGSEGRYDVDFSLLPAAKIRGTVVDRVTQAPIADARLDLWRRNIGNGLTEIADFAQTDSQGRYEFSNVDLLDYQVVVRAPAYISQRYPAVPCFVHCVSGIQSWITTSGGATVDIGTFQLDQGVTIHGYAHTPGTSQGRYDVAVFDDQGNYIDSVRADETGAYQFPPWLPGTYYLKAESDTECQLYRQLPCGQAANSGTPVTELTPGKSIRADFDLLADPIQRNGFEDQ